MPALCLFFTLLLCLFLLVTSPPPPFINKIVLSRLPFNFCKGNKDDGTSLHGATLAEHVNDRPLLDMENQEGFSPLGCMLFIYLD